MLFCVMLKGLRTEKIIFIDVETIPQTQFYDDLPERWQQLWDKKARFLISEEQTPKDVYQQAGIYAEFGKIVCISCGIVQFGSNGRMLRLKSYAGENEKELLQNFANMLNALDEEHLLCAHNGKEFDFPYICRRMLINQVEMPKILDIQGKKPWEIQHIDTMQMWKFGDYKHFTSLDLLAAVFDIPTPKDDIDGSMVYSVYYEDKDLPRIVKYCEKDVLTLVNLFLKWKGALIIEPHELKSV